MRREKKSYRQKSMFWKPIRPTKQALLSRNGMEVALSTNTSAVSSAASPTMMRHALVNETENERLRKYESETKTRFDEIERVVKSILQQKSRSDFIPWANRELQATLGVEHCDACWNDALGSHHLENTFQKVYARTLFKQFLKMSSDFFSNDPLGGQRKKEAENIFKESGFHAVGVAPCADGRLTHFVSYVLRLPYSLIRRKAHAGALFDVSESVRNWVFVEHNRFREGVPNDPEEPTRYLKMAVYHFSKSEPSCQGCAAHGSNDAKAAEAAQERLKSFKQAIENRFGCGSSVQTLLIGVNTDDDTFKLHVPNEQGYVCLERYVDTGELFGQTEAMTADKARAKIHEALAECNTSKGSTAPQLNVQSLLAKLVENNFSQIAYVKRYEGGCYSDIGHEERFIGVGSGFEEVQLRNLTYYGFLDTIEEGANDVDVGIKIFKELNVTRGLPIPIIVRCDYDGRVPGSRERAEQKALRIEKAIHQRYEDLSKSGVLQTMPTLRDKMGLNPAEKIVGGEER